MQSEHAARDASALPRHIGWFTAGCVLVSNVVGSGIFTTTGFMARDLGHPGLILSVWLTGALIALAGALSYSELGAALPVAGGEYVYLRRAYGPCVGFLSGWTSLTIGFGAAIAAGAVSFAAYGLQLVPCEDEGGLCSTALALALLWAITGVHLAGVGAGGALQRTLTVLKVGAILVLIAAGLMVGTGDWAHLRVTDAQVPPGFGPWCVALIFALYAYSGWNAAAYLAGEITESARTILRTMIGGTLCVGSRTSGLRIMFRALSRSVCVVCISRSSARRTYFHERVHASWLHLSTLQPLYTTIIEPHRYSDRLWLGPQRYPVQ